MLITRSLLSVILPTLALANEFYTFKKQYAGPNFFEEWEFFNNFDNLTSGSVNYVSRQVAVKQNLAYVNEVGNAIIKVDNKTKLSSLGDFRNSIRIQTQALHGMGSLWVADMVHVPYGCSVWPAWWSGAPDWPKSGEIDTFEYVNMMPNNQMGLHTLPGCTLDTSPKNKFTGLANSTECSYEFNQNQGCIIQNTNKTSYGEGFAKADGGMFVTQFSKSAVSIWFFSRPDIPATLVNQTGDINITALGTPVARYSASACDMNFIQPQHLTLNIDLCGDYAGNSAVFAQTCSGNCYSDYVMGPPSTYDNAYFEIKSIRTYYDPDTPSAIFTPVGGPISQAAPPIFTAKPGSSSSAPEVSKSWISWCIILFSVFLTRILH